MSDIDDLNERLNELQKELEKKELEKIALLDKVEYLEDTVMKYEDIIDNKGSGDISKDLQSSKLAIENEAKERHIRELKNTLSYLRKENIEIKRQIKKLTKKNGNSSVIIIEEKKPPLQSLVSELQRKINKQEIIISKLKKKGSAGANLSVEIEKKNENIESLKSKVSELNGKLEAVRDTTETEITEKLSKKFQQKLNKTLKEVDNLKKKLANYEKKGKKKIQRVGNGEITRLQNAINELKEMVNKKDKKIGELRKNLSEKTTLHRSPIKLTSGDLISNLTEELQGKLNKSKIQIRTLTEQLDNYKKLESQLKNDSNKHLIAELETSKQMAVRLQQKVKEQQQLLEAKDEQYNTIKNEAIQINLKFKELEDQVNLKEQTISELGNQMQSFKAKTQLQRSDVEDPQISLRFREMRSLIDDLKKQIMEQRLEISKLREK